MVDKDILETVLLKVSAAIPGQDPKLANAYLRLLQPAVKSEDLLVVPRGGFEIRSKILGCEELTQSAALILSGSFVSATLRWFDVDLAAVAELPGIYEPVQIMDL